MNFEPVLQERFESRCPLVLLVLQLVASADAPVPEGESAKVSPGLWDEAQHLRPYRLRRCAWQKDRRPPRELRLSERPAGPLSKPHGGPASLAILPQGSQANELQSKGMATSGPRCSGTVTAVSNLHVRPWIPRGHGLQASVPPGWSHPGQARSGHRWAARPRLGHDYGSLGPVFLETRLKVLNSGRGGKA